jgi:hypothetical protein
MAFGFPTIRPSLTVTGRLFIRQFILSKRETDAIEQVNVARVRTERVEYRPEFQRGHKRRVFQMDSIQARISHSSFIERLSGGNIPSISQA